MKSRASVVVRPRTLAALLLLALCGVVAPQPARAVQQTNDEDVVALVAHVARTYAEATRGVLAVRSTSDLRIDAPVFRKRIHDDSWFVFRDGTLAESSKPEDPRRPQLHEPYREIYLAEYHFAYAPCVACANETVAIAFDSPLHDTAHAHGILTVDVASGRIVASSETPYRLPWPTTGGSLDATWGEVAGGWFPIAITGEFVGRIGPFVGHAHYRQALSSYERYATLDAAARSLTTSAN